jgi:hypothetical protein
MSRSWNLCRVRNGTSAIFFINGFGGLVVSMLPSGTLWHTSRPALGPAQSPVQWVPGLSRG